jgi:hypothetical protein
VGLQTPPRAGACLLASPSLSLLENRMMLPDKEAYEAHRPMWINTSQLNAEIVLTVAQSENDLRFP